MGDIVFLQTKKILLVDPSNSSRTSIQKALYELGASKKNVVTAKNFVEAKADILARSPEVIVTEFNLEKHFGLDLLQLQSSYVQSTREKLFVLITQNSSETVVAEAAEEDVDAFVLKPFSYEVLVSYLKKAIEQKISLSAYRKTIESGKNCLKNSDFSQAANLFSGAKRMEPKSMLASYYLAQTFEKMEKFDQALVEYDQGLKLSPIHYKCLVGQFELLDKLGRKKEAYAVLQNMIQHFPISPQRLGKIFNLAVHTRNFTDVEKYYQLYVQMEHRPSEVSRIVFAGLYVCGKYLLKKGKPEEAEKIFQKLSTSSGRNDTVLEKIVEAFLEHQQHKIADGFLRMLSPQIKETERYLNLDFEIAINTEAPNVIIDKGQKLIQANSRNPKVYELVARHLMDTKKTHIAEEIVYKATKLFPDKREFFLAILPAA